MPTNAKTGIQNILEAADYFFDTTGRQVTFEYILLAGLNDGPMQAEQLGSLLSHRKSHVNLIPFNPFPAADFARSSRETIRHFAEVLTAAGLIATTRKTRGDDIDAACGQLAGRIEDRTRRVERLERREAARVSLESTSVRSPDAAGALASAVAVEAAR
jgi:23S rRNA (adenine2503-C2)-methyltransferase